MLAVATAGPAVTIPVTHANGTVIIAMDVSGSMAATDVAPSRLGAAKKAAQAFVNAQPPSVDIGVVAFEQGGLEAAVPTADHATTLAAIGRLNTGGGTSLGSAILASLSAITHRTVSLGPNGSAPSIGFWPSATIVLFSDGQGDGAAASGSGGHPGHRHHRRGRGRAEGRRARRHGRRRHRRGHHRRRRGIPPVHRARRGHAQVDLADDRRNLPSRRPTASELNGIASSINLRLTVTNQPLPLAGAFIAFALALLAAGAVLTVARTGRVV